MGGCEDPRFEQMLHAFELGMLSESDREGLQVHLLECQYCLRTATEFRDAALLLRDDPDVKSAVDRLAKKNNGRGGWVVKY